MLRLLFAAATAAAITPALSAQGLTVPQLIGFTSGGPSFANLIQRQPVCRPVQRVCPTGMASAAGWAGGAAYNAITRGVWHTQGTRMAEIRIDDCRLLCTTPATLLLGPGSVASGLAICESRLQLYQLESIRGVAALHTRHLRSCPLNVLRSCRFPLPTNRHSAGALAFNERDGLFFYATSIFPVTGVVAPQNIILVAKASDPCNILCKIPVPNCGNMRLGAITAMTYDSCAELLYISDGRQTTVRKFGSTGNCTLTEARCCTVGPTTGRWNGFDIEPIHARKVGRSCLGASCRPCNNVELVSIGDPVVGNPGFAYRVQSGQTGAQTILAVSLSGCSSMGIPLFCGRLHLGANVLLFPAQNLSGIGCNGSATWPSPLPKNFALCGLNVCAQAAFLCPSPAGTTVGLTNALALRVSN